MTFFDPTTLEGRAALGEALARPITPYGDPCPFETRGNPFGVASAKERGWSLADLAEPTAAEHDAALAVERASRADVAAWRTAASRAISLRPIVRSLEEPWPDAAHGVYAIEAGYGEARGPERHVKFGRAKNVRDRLRELQTGNHRELRVLWILVCERRAEQIAIEQIVHDFYAEWRGVGEWFRLPFGVCRDAVLHDPRLVAWPGLRRRKLW